VHGVGSNHFGVLFTAFGERDHELSKTISANLVVKAEIGARLIEGATQRDKLRVVESFGEHGNLEQLPMVGL
jgi:hypothetical protein